MSEMRGEAADKFSLLNVGLVQLLAVVFQNNLEGLLLF